MKTERWQQIEAVLQQALDLPVADREPFVRGACGEDHGLREETNSLIEALGQAGDFMEEPALTRDAEVLVTALPDRNVGRTIGSYTLVKRIGAGGMGEVYLAEDGRLGRKVALKILPLSLAGEQLARFQTEARAVSSLNHPNVLTIHEIGSEADTHFIATEFIEGRTVRELIDEDAVSIEEAVDICLQVGSALQAAHSAGIIHRDIKPENIMRRPDGLVKVLDFGIAKPNRALGTSFSTPEHQTEIGVILGTVGYMSPEQARGLAVDERTDVWSLGVVLYEMVAKRLPFTGPTKMDVLASILERDPPILETGRSAAVVLILEKCLRKDRSERYQSVAELLANLRYAQEELSHEAHSDLIGRGGPPWPPLVGLRSTQARVAHKLGRVPELSGQSTSRRKAVVVATAFLVLTLGASIAVWLWQGRSGISSQVPVQTKLYRDMTTEERLAFIDQQEQRISAMMGDRPTRLNRDALQAIEKNLSQYLLLVEPDSLNDIVQRAVPYVPLIAKEFTAQKVPIAIGIYLPMIESAYHPCEESQYGAKGIFQFLPGTARQYGVAPHEMCDASKMTPAAARYIADRMAELGEDAQSMTLVLLSYNRGPERVRNELRELRGTANFQRNFWTLFAHRERLDDTFRNESAGYVPRFFAAAIIGENPQVFGLNTPPLSSLANR